MGTTTKQRQMELELAFVRMCLEVEQEHGGQIFIDRAPHCSLWSARIFWPEWRNAETGGVCAVEHFYGALNWAGIGDVEYVILSLRNTFINALEVMKANEHSFTENKKAELRRQLAALELLG